MKGTVKLFIIILLVLVSVSAVAASDDNQTSIQADDSEAVLTHEGSPESQLLADSYDVEGDDFMLRDCRRQRTCAVLGGKEGRERQKKATVFPWGDGRTFRPFCTGIIRLRSACGADIVRLAVGGRNGAARRAYQSLFYQRNHSFLYANAVRLPHGAGQADAFGGFDVACDAGKDGGGCMAVANPCGGDLRRGGGGERWLRHFLPIRPIFCPARHKTQSGEIRLNPCIFYRLWYNSRKRAKEERL